MRLRTVQDVEGARRQGLPFFLIQSQDLRILHYPMRIPTTVIVPREYANLVDSRFRVHVFQSLRALQNPTIEDIVAFLLSFDLIAARSVVDRNRDLIDFARLRKRIVQEDLEEEATKVHLQDYVDVPVSGVPLPKDALLRATARNRVSGVLP